MPAAIRILKNTTETLPCKLTDEELRQKGDDLASITQELDAEEGRQKDIKDQLKAKLSGLQSKQREISLTITRREEFREVKVLTQLLVNDQMVQKIRQDTGEIIEARPARDLEMQSTLIDPKTDK